MPKITYIEYKADRERYWIFVDGEYCSSIRARTFPALNLRVGLTISCEKIKELESHHWKHAYGQSAWDKEKIRLRKVKELIESFDSRVSTEIVGFGADTNTFIAGHPTEAGKPDLEVKLQECGRVIMLLEVTGTEFMRGTKYWVRPDKLRYFENHPTEDIWLVLHFLRPVEKFVFIKPDPQKRYAISEKEIRGSIELYVEFSDADQEVVSMEHFRNHLLNLINT
ncbi:hypothetical protein [Aeromonas caviae]|uniref:hypothetical protein n=1 Tax=Aeromonas caviae TaxID=648 RepID=UPI0025B6F459|nr:hypothetical protein [Aeromonas caviae]